MPTSECEASGLFRARPGAAGGFGRSGRDRLRGRITESQQDLPRLLWRVLTERGECGAESCHAEVFFALSALDSIDEGCEIDQFAASIHEIKIQNLLACHAQRI